jgi:hypothetical protein
MANENNGEQQTPKPMERPVLPPNQPYEKKDYPLPTPLPKPIEKR